MVMIMRASALGSRYEGSTPSEVDIHDWIEAAVSTDVREIISKMFGTIKIELIAFLINSMLPLPVPLPPQPLLQLHLERKICLIESLITPNP